MESEKMLQANQKNTSGEIDEKRRNFYTVYEKHINSKEYLAEIDQLLSRFSIHLQTARLNQSEDISRSREFQSFDPDQFIISYIKIISGNALTVYTKEEIKQFVSWFTLTANYLVDLVKVIDSNFDFKSNLRTNEGLTVAQLAIVSCLNHYQKWQEAHPSVIPSQDNKMLILNFLFQRPYDEPKILYQDLLSPFLDLVIKHGQETYQDTTFSKTFQETHDDIRKLITSMIDCYRDALTCQSLEKLLESTEKSIDEPSLELNIITEEISGFKDFTLAEKMANTKKDAISQTKEILNKYKYIINSYQEMFVSLSKIIEDILNTHPEIIGVLNDEQKELLEQKLKIELLREISGDHTSELPETEDYIQEIVNNNTPIKQLLFKLRNTQVRTDDLILGNVDARVNHRDMRTFSNLLLNHLLDKTTHNIPNINSTLKFEALVKELAGNLAESNNNLMKSLENLFINPENNIGDFGLFKTTQKIIIKKLWTKEYIQTVLDKHPILKNSVNINADYVLGLVNSWNL